MFMYCENCGEKIPDNSKFCNHCGSKLSTHIVQKEDIVGPNFKFCGNCGVDISEDIAFCHECGINLVDDLKSDGIKGIIRLIDKKGK